MGIKPKASSTFQPQLKMVSSSVLAFWFSLHGFLILTFSVLTF